MAAMETTPRRFLPLTGLFEPSAIVQLADGRFLVVEDEKTHPLSVFTLAADGRVDSQPLAPDVSDDEFWKLADLEGLTGDRQGRVYAITSHSRSGEGKEKPARDKLARFRLEGNRVRDARLVTGLKPALTATHPVLAAAAAVTDVKAGGGLNIEAIEFNPEGNQLLIGLRGPLLEGRALIARIDNPDAMFDTGEPPRVHDPLITLDLAGQGIRGLCHAPGLGGWLVISGPLGRDAAPFRLWFWDGRAGSAARRVEIPALPSLEHAEGICPASLEGRPWILIVSDDGDRAAGRCARYVRLAPSELRIAP